MPDTIPNDTGYARRSRTESYKDPNWRDPTSFILVRKERARLDTENSATSIYEYRTEWDEQAALRAKQLGLDYTATEVRVQKRTIRLAVAADLLVAWGGEDLRIPYDFTVGDETGDIHDERPHPLAGQIPPPTEKYLAWRRPEEFTRFAEWLDELALKARVPQEAERRFPDVPQGPAGPTIVAANGVRPGDESDLPGPAVSPSIEDRAELPAG